MTLNKRKEAFVKLGTFFRLFLTDKRESDFFSGELFEKFDEALEKTILHNPWFTRDAICFSLRQWGDQLQSENVDAWLASYPLEERTPKRVAVIMAGNIPLVGFHDFICVLLAGHSICVKTSSKDRFLLPCIAEILTAINETFADRIEIVAGILSAYDAVIATGSDNSARYFSYYFKDKPKIIRKNRNSVAVLSGKENQEELEKLGEDVFKYYGKGCRSVAKLFVPEGYDFSTFFEALHKWKPLINSHKYANNYEYNRAVFLMNEIPILDNGFLLLKEDEGYSSPIGCLFYEYYTSTEQLKAQLNGDRSLLQSIVSNIADLGDTRLGYAQKPRLNDYADGIDTMKFLHEL